MFEAKNKRLSKNDAWTELNACMAERDAAYAVLVVAGDDKIPAGLERARPSTRATRSSPSSTARIPTRSRCGSSTGYVRARVAGRRSRRGLEVDAAGVRDAAEEAAAQLKRAQPDRKSLTGVTNSADAAREELDAMIATSS